MPTKRQETPPALAPGCPAETMAESGDWGPDLSPEACSRADLAPLLDESA